jgi:hypothetical protein
MTSEGVDSACEEDRIFGGRAAYRATNPEEGLMGMPSVESERTVRLSSMLGRVGAKALYTYDFGYGWEHSLVVEKRLPVDSNTAYPVCTDGQLA